MTLIVIVGIGVVIWLLILTVFVLRRFTMTQDEIDALTQQVNDMNAKMLNVTGDVQALEGEVQALEEQLAAGNEVSLDNLKAALGNLNATIENTDALYPKAPEG